jgi:hypothetical protein
MLLEQLIALESYGPVVSFSESLFAYPVVQGIHVLALALAIGLLALADLRLVGVALTNVPARRVVSELRPWFIAGFALLFVTGLLLFIPKAVELYESTLFRVKLVLILLAGINALWFELAFRKQQDEGTPRHLRIAGLVSLLLWTTIIVLGRLLAYF